MTESIWKIDASGYGTGDGGGGGVFGGMQGDMPGSESDPPMRHAH